MRERACSPIVRCILLAGLTATIVRAQSAPGADVESIAGVLVERGYENVAVRTVDGATVVWCENRRIRFPVVWMLEALTVAAERVSSEVPVRVVAMRHARPVTGLEARGGDVLAWVDGALSTAEFRERLSVEYQARSRAPERRNSSLRRFDVVVGPGRLIHEFGVPDGIFIRSLLDASGSIEVTAAPGVTGYAQVLVPIHVKSPPVGGAWRNGETRPGSILLGYFRSVGTSSFATMTVGAFELASPLYDSYGVLFDVEQFTPDGRWSFGVNAGLFGSGTYFIENELDGRYRVWQMSVPPRRWLYLARLGYRFTSVDLRVVAQWGEFLGGDRGWRVDVERKFGEIGVTFYGLKSDGEAFRDREQADPEDTRLLGGFRLEIPLFPRNRGMPAPLRVTSSSRIRWSYRYRVGNVGVGVPTVYTAAELVDDYNPVTILNNLDRAYSRISRD